MRFNATGGIAGAIAFAMGIGSYVSLADKLPANSSEIHFHKDGRAKFMHELTPYETAREMIRKGLKTNNPELVKEGREYQKVLDEYKEASLALERIIYPERTRTCVTNTEEEPFCLNEENVDVIVDRLMGNPRKLKRPETSYANP